MKQYRKIGFFFGISIILFACKKNETQTVTERDNVSKSWKLTQRGSDVNNNKTFETEEKNAVDPSESYSYQLKNSGAGFKVGDNNQYVDTLTWEFFGDKGLHMRVNNRGFYQDLYYKYEYGSDVLTLRDTTVSPDFFMEFRLE